VSPPSGHKHIKELAHRSPASGIAGGADSCSSATDPLRACATPREAAARQTAEQLARAMTSEPPRPPQNHDSSSTSTTTATRVARRGRRPDGDTGQAAHQNPSQQADQEGEGAEIAIPRGYRLRPVEALQEITAGPVFRPVLKGGRLQPSVLTPQVVRFDREALHQAMGPSPHARAQLALRLLTCPAGEAEFKRS
jgi:hypothetical protein